MFKLDLRTRNYFRLFTELLIFLSFATPLRSTAESFLIELPSTSADPGRGLETPGNHSPAPGIKEDGALPHSGSYFLIHEDRQLDPGHFTAPVGQFISEEREISEITLSNGQLTAPLLPRPSRPHDCVTLLRSRLVWYEICCCASSVGSIFAGICAAHNGSPMAVVAALESIGGCLFFLHENIPAPVGLMF